MDHDRNKKTWKPVLNSINAHSNTISLYIALFSLIFSIFTFYMTVKIEEHSNYLSDLQAPCIYKLKVSGNVEFPKVDAGASTIELDQTRIVLAITSGSVLDIGNVVMSDDGYIERIRSWSIAQYQPANKEMEAEEEKLDGTTTLSYRPGLWNYEASSKSAYTVLFVKTGNNTSDIWLLVLDENGKLSIYGYDALAIDPDSKYPKAFEAYRKAREFLVANDI